MLTIVTTFHPNCSKDALEGVNLFFIFAFTLEAVIKLVAFGVCEYLVQGWNQLDFALVLIALVGVAVRSIGSVGTAFRTLRLLRALKFIRGAPGLKALLTTMVTPAALILPYSNNMLLDGKGLMCSIGSNHYTSLSEIKQKKV